MKIDPATWSEVQHHEEEYWGNCLNLRTWGEFTKQEMYGREMGLISDYGDGQGELSMQGKSVMDVGGGPVSMTLRCINAGRLIVVDPCNWPASVLRRYKAYGIEFIQESGENLHTRALGRHDEVWVYNVLQHTQNPKAVLNNALARVKCGGVLRIFEWLNIPADKCHPHVLTSEWLLNALAGTRVEQIRIRRLKEYWSDADALAGVFSNG